MNSTAAPPVAPEIERSVMQMLASGQPFESVINAMQAAGLDKIDCVKLLRAHAAISLFEAKKTVHLSVAWDARRQDDDTFHDSTQEAVNTLMVVQQN